MLDEHVYVDDGISGAEFANRPGFLRLMNALKPRAPFQFLAMSEESRLGREAIETAYSLKQLVQAGVRVFFYLEDRERTLDSPTDKIMMSLTAFADELEREKARQRTSDATSRNARAGHVTGGRTFGYDNVDVLTPDGNRSHVTRTINEAEAEIVRTIFSLSAQGVGMTSIAKRLNADGAISPRAQQGRPKAWAPSTVRSVLYRELYAGVVVWNKTKKRDSWGQAKRKARPEAEWVRLTVPQWQIVSTELWRAAHARLAKAREVYLRGTHGHLWGRPPRGPESKYLLPGLGRCGSCEGAIYVKSRSHGQKRACFYGCTSYHLRGSSVCGNGIEVPMETANRVVLEAFDKLLTPAVFEKALDEAIRQITTAPEGAEVRGEDLAKQLTGVSLEIGRLTEALAAGGEITSLVAALKDREARRTALADEIGRLPTVAPPPNVAQLKRALRERLADWREMLGRRAPQARQILKKLLDGPVVFQPVREGIRQGWSFVGFGKLSAVLPAGGFAKILASPTGTALALDAEIALTWEVAA